MDQTLCLLQLLQQVAAQVVLILQTELAVQQAVRAAAAALTAILELALLALPHLQVKVLLAATVRVAVDFLVVQAAAAAVLPLLETMEAQFHQAELAAAAVQVEQHLLLEFL
jgi:hypothetical protein